jgi:hypothetical protein
MKPFFVVLWLKAYSSDSQFYRRRMSVHEAGRWTIGQGDVPRVGFRPCIPFEGVSTAAAWGACRYKQDEMHEAAHVGMSC